MKTGGESIYYLYMSKPATLSDEAYEAVKAAKKDRRDSISAVILRYVPRPIETFGDLHRHLESNGPVVVDLPALKRLKDRKRKANHAD